MSVDESGAYELKHSGNIHRTSSFSELKSWVLESRVTADDSFREAGSDQWLSVMSEPELAAILNPDSQWIVSMKTGVFKAHRFDTVVKWAEQGRITEDAIVEGPRTPPGGVMATALPALALNLRSQVIDKPDLPVLRIDGRAYTANDTETIREWIKYSRVPVESEISLEGKKWEPIVSCGLFDLEDWPLAAHGRIEEPLPEMPARRPNRIVFEDEPAVVEEHSEEQEDASISGQSLDEITDAAVDESAKDEIEEAPYTVVSGNSEMTIESVAKLRSLLKKKMIFTYDEIKHPSISEETISVGEFLDSLKSPGKGVIFWILWTLFVAAISFGALEYFDILDFFAWL